MEREKEGRLISFLCPQEDTQAWAPEGESELNEGMVPHFQLSKDVLSFLLGVSIFLILGSWESE